MYTCKFSLIILLLWWVTNLVYYITHFMHIFVRSRSVSPLKLPWWTHLWTNLVIYTNQYNLLQNTYNATYMSWELLNALNMDQCGLLYNINHACMYRWISWEILHASFGTCPPSNLPFIIQFVKHKWKSSIIRDLEEIVNLLKSPICEDEQRVFYHLL